MKVNTASMRPRVFPAEDVREGLLLSSAVRASMRPRVFPAEDGIIAQLALRGHGEASMRPRVFPAEDSRAALRVGARPALQ